MPALHRAREAADAVGLPIMIHPNAPVCTLDDILREMKAGDLLTHCYHGLDEGIIDDDGRVRASVRAAVNRGVHLDVGHGQGSFSWSVAESALAQDLVPDTISSDLHAYNVNGPVYDLATTLSKFLHLGLSLSDALRRCTVTPAEILGMRGQIGTLAVGAFADVALFREEIGRPHLRGRARRDAHRRAAPGAGEGRQRRQGHQRRRPRLASPPSLGESANGLLVAQGLDGPQPRGAVGGVDAEHQADGLPDADLAPSRAWNDSAQSRVVFGRTTWSPTPRRCGRQIRAGRLRTRAEWVRQGGGDRNDVGEHWHALWRLTTRGDGDGGGAADGSERPRGVG